MIVRKVPFTAQCMYNVCKLPAEMLPIPTFVAPEVITYGMHVQVCMYGHPILILSCVSHMSVALYCTVQI